MIKIQFIFEGGLGNQLFQYLASRNISSNFKIFNISYTLTKYFKGSRDFELNKLLIQPVKIVETLKVDKKIKFTNKIPLIKSEHKSKLVFFLNLINNRYFEETGTNYFVDPLLKLNKDLKSLKYKKKKLSIHGFWQNPSCYLNNLPNYLTNFIETRYLLPKELIPNNYLTIHIRRGDYYLKKDILEFYFSRFFPTRYILAALQLLPEDLNNMPILLLSDDKYWRNKMIEILSKSTNKKIYAIETDDDLEDWAIMRHAALNICSNSTFSYSAALLNKDNENRKLRCIVPQWINKNETAFEKGWVKPEGFIDI